MSGVTGPQFAFLAFLLIPTLLPLEVSKGVETISGPLTMKTKLIAFAISFAIFSSCEDASRPVPNQDVVLTNAQVIFGHLGSFRINPDILYKLENNTLYTTHRLPSIDLQNLPPFYPATVSDSLKSAVSTLFQNLPSALTSSSSHVVGSYFPDVGYAYIQIKKDSLIQYWDLEGSLPADLQNFSAQLNNLLAKLE